MSDLPGLIVLILRLLLAIALYMFLAWAIWIIWRSLNQTSVEHSMQPITLSARSGSLEVSTHILTEPDNILGRAPDCHVSLEDEAVSNQHARIFYQRPQWWLEDLGSSNGTYLNDLDITMPAALADGDIIQLGNTIATINLVLDQDNRSLTNKEG